METRASAFASGLPQASEISGTVRPATAENRATALILRAPPRLRCAHPHLTLEIATDIATVNLHRRDVDIALRMVRPERGHVSVQRVGRLGYGLYTLRNHRVLRTILID
jgi:DNA-binding transcriptional LysR family regulator